MKRTTPPILFLLLISWASSAWAQKVNYQDITPEQLPVGTKIIPQYAFENREDLVEVTIPEGVEVLAPDAFFGCTNLKKVTLPTTLVSAKGAFTFCANLKEITCLGLVPPAIGPTPTYHVISPKNLQWYNNINDLYEGFKWGQNGGGGIDGESYGASGTANWYVYDNTDIDNKRLAIEKIIMGEVHYEDESPNLSVKWTSDAYGLYGYNTDRNFTIRDNEWPYDQMPYLTLKMRDHQLNYPAFTQYELIPGWNHFPSLQAFEQPQPTSIRVGADYSLLNAPFTNKPDLTIAVSIDNEQKVYYAGHASFYDGTHSYGTFNLEQDAWENNIRVQTAGTVHANVIDQSHPSFYTETSMRADQVKTTLRFDEDSYSQYGSSPEWIFTSLPFDCRLSDVRVTEGGNNLQWVIYKHSGQMRANAQFNDVWVKQTTDDILHAGEGFIFSCGWNNYVDRSAAIEFPAINNANKNRLFTTEDVTIPLQQYIASAESNRSWNFIGNPYPCFYSTKYFEPSMPFVVWEKTWESGYSQGNYKMGYKTFSPIDDDYILSPFQGFFVQRPLGHDALNFPEYGRFATVNEYEDFMGELMGEPDLSRESSSAPRQIGRRRAAAPRPPVGTMENRRVINLVLQNADGIQLDRTRLVGNPDAAATYEVACDATKFPDLTGNSTLLYIIGTDKTHYAISEQPFVEGDEVSVGAKFPTAGTYTLQANFKTVYPDLDGKVMLIDYETGTTQPATEPYTFTTQAGEITTRFALSYGNEATGISSVATPSQHSGQTYDLAGRLVTGTPRPGIYIKNGKKIIIK
ncbi:MAG: leucine-rich repeat domain-containing protein [Bacteroidaceae bacterium]|nr:leucine-rich repeat domain-containing protein [Bacteroidaceae bacterium]